MLIDACTVLTDNYYCGRTIFVYGDKNVSFDDFRKDVTAYAYFFKKEISASEVILYLPNNVYLFYVCFMALLHAGKNVTLPGFLTADGVDDVHAKDKTIVTDLVLNRDDLLVINPEKCELCSGDELKPIGKKYVSFYTSGTTGAPKKIIKTFNTLVAEVGNIYFYQKKAVENNAAVLATVMPFHLYGMLWRFLFPLCTGLVQDLDTITSPEKIQEKQEKHDYVVLATTPSFMDKVAEYKKQYVFKNNCMAIYSSGSFLSEKTSKAMLEIFGVSPFEVFGSSETGGVAYRQQKDGKEWNVFPTVSVEADEETRLVVNSDFTMINPYVMRDSVTMTSPKTFILKGRLDRMIKIAEMRVSLPEMEEHMEAYKFVNRAYVLPLEGNNRTILGGVITLTDQGKDFFKKNGKKKLVAGLKAFLKSWFEQALIPKKFRIINEMPVNSQGKIVSDDIASLFRSAYTEPLMENIVIKKDSFSALLTFMEDAAYFSGHFPGYPILPGVVQLYFVLYSIQHYLRRPFGAYTVKKLKFNKLILPMKTIAFALHKKDDNEYDFSFGSDEVKYSSGTIAVGN